MIKQVAEIAVFALTLAGCTWKGEMGQPVVVQPVVVQPDVVVIEPGQRAVRPIITK